MTTSDATVTPTETENLSGGDTITITTPLYTTSTPSVGIYMLSIDEYNAVVADPSSISSYTPMTCQKADEAYLEYTCTTPAKTAGSYKVYVNIPDYDRNFAMNFTYVYVQTFWNISNMQDMTPELCASVTKPSSANVSTIATTEAAYLANPGGVVPQRTLIDPRGSEPYKSYTIRKLADGRCWMTDSLALVGASGGTTLTPANTDLSGISSYTLPQANSTFSTSGTNTGQNMTIDNASYPGAY